MQIIRWSLPAEGQVLESWHSEVIVSPEQLFEYGKLIIDLLNGPRRGRPELN